MWFLSFVMTSLIFLPSMGQGQTKALVEEPRTVDVWDYERLSGFFEFEAAEKKAEAERRLGVDEVKAQKIQDEKEIARALADYKIEKKGTDRPRNDEDDPLYQAHLKEQANEQRLKEQQRQDFIFDRDQLKRTGKRAPVSESKELDIANDRDRVDWHYRALYGGSVGKPVRSSILSPPTRNDGPSDFAPTDPGGFVPPMTDEGVIPPFENTEPEVFDEDIPPPPPPPESFDELNRPPGLDEGDF